MPPDGNRPASGRSFSVVYRVDDPVEPTIGFEPMTPSLPRKCSTPEPRGHEKTTMHPSKPPARKRSQSNLPMIFPRTTRVKGAPRLDGPVSTPRGRLPERPAPVSPLPGGDRRGAGTSPRSDESLTPPAAAQAPGKNSNQRRSPGDSRPRVRSASAKGMERETGFEPATNSLEGCDSTPELLPRLGDEVDGGGGWIRTNVGLRRQIYSLLPLTARPLLRVLSIALGRALEPAPGVEPGTYGLQDRRSTG